LQPQDFNGRVDGYIQIHLGNKRVVRDNTNYVPSNINPTFARCALALFPLPLVRFAAV
jgi:hypothetical protein